MAKNAITQYSATASENTDVGGVNILGTAPVANFDDAFRILMAQLADMNSGTSPLDATFTLQDPDNNLIQIQPDLAGMPATLTTIPMLPLSRSGTAKVTTYTSSGTHTFATGSKKYQVIGVSGGGAGRSVYSSLPSGITFAAGPGGCSGQFGVTTIRSIAFDGDGVPLTAAVTIGAGGTSSVDASGNVTGVAGGDTVWVHDTLTLTLNGGNSFTGTSTGAQAIEAIPGLSGRSRTSGWLSLGQNIGEISISGVAGGVSGGGASSPYGTGGAGQNIPASAGATAGNDATGYGAGGGGAVARTASGGAQRAKGGDGSPGILIVMEW